MLEQLKQYATPRQLEILEAVIKCGSNNKAAKHLGLHRRGVDQQIKAVKKKAAIHGYSPEHDMTRLVPEPFVVRGVSTFYNKDGKPSGQWVKSRLDDNKYQELIAAFAEGLKDEIEPIEAVEFDRSCNNNLTNCYVITDYHLGMLSWGEETGADWDISIAEQMLVKWFQQAIELSPNAENAVFAQLSDFLHFDGMYAVTPESKHLLDADSRFSKLVRVAIRVLRQCIAMLLTKHKHVHLIMADANHDPVSQIWLREFFSILYENEPRITIDKSPSPYLAYEFGNVALFFHHGHKRNVSNVAEVFAGQFREIYGRTKYAYAHLGHLHCTKVEENNLMLVEQHRTLAAPDAYAARGGWLSGRDAKVITYHKQFGEVSRITINSDMLKD